MKKIKVIVLAIIMSMIGSLGLIAQIQMDRSLFCNAGGSVMLSNTQLDYSLGETMIGFHRAGNIMVYEGFHQGQIDDLSTAQRDLELANISLQAFPNPTSNDIHIALKDDDLIRLSIHNHLGELIRHVSLMRDSRNISIDMKSLAAGIYLARVFTTRTPAGFSIKLIKQ